MDKQQEFPMTKKPKVVKNIDDDEEVLNNNAITHAENIMSKYKQDIIDNKSSFVQTIRRSSKNSRGGSQL